MKKIKNLLYIAAFLSIAAVSCHNNDGDDNPPVVTISSPTVNESITGGVSIVGLVTDEGLHELSIKVTKDSDGSELYSSEPTVHDLTSYSIAQVWVPGGLTGETPVTLTVTAADHDDQQTTVTVKFKVAP